MANELEKAITIKTAIDKIDETFYCLQFKGGLFGILIKLNFSLIQ
jgi:hypothetical protein